MTDARDSVHLMLMENTMQLKNSNNLKYIFDLKGSLDDRKFKEQITNKSILKDADFIQYTSSNKPEQFIDLDDELKVKIMGVVRKDVDFLSEMGFMDYSLLLGIESIGKISSLVD